MTDRELDEIRSRCKAASPGPWNAYDPCYGTCPYGAMPCTPEGCHENHPVGVRCVGGPETSDGDLVTLGCDSDIEFGREVDAAFVAHARQDIPALLDEIDRLRAELARMGSGGVMIDA